MKIIICPRCEDWVKLRLHDMRHCECGHVYGRYINRVEAEVSEDAISVGCGNGSFVQAYAKLLDAIRNNPEMDRNEYIKHCYVLTWLRPNEGPGNPHSKVIMENIIAPVMGEGSPFETPCYKGGIKHKTCGPLGSDCCWCKKHDCEIGHMVK